MATIQVTNELDVLKKYNDLVQQSLGGDSVYIRTRETLEDFFAKGNLKDTEKAEILATVLNNLNSSLVNVSMSTALQWAVNEKDTELKKLELALQLDILAQEKLLKEAQVGKMGYESVAVQAQTRRTYGVPTVIDGAVASLTDDGKVYYDIEISKQQNINLGKEAIILDSRLNESYAAIHKVVADTYTNYGNFSYSLNSTGLNTISDNTSLSHTPQIVLQSVIAKQQANGYAYNVWANALTGTASMLGTALAAEITDEIAINNLVTEVAGITTQMKNAILPYTEYQS